MGAGRGGDTIWEASQGKDRKCAAVSLALVQNQHTDAILAPALYTKYQLEWRAMRVCVFGCLRVCVCAA